MCDDFNDPAEAVPVQDSPSGTYRYNTDFDVMSLLQNDGRQQDGVQRSVSYPEQLPFFVAVPRQRRKRQPWTDEETKRLLKGVHMFGRGNWAVIQQQFGFLETRTTTDLKDKWRNLVDPRKNARTSKELKQLADVIQKEQTLANPANRPVFSYVPAQDGGQGLINPERPIPAHVTTTQKYFEMADAEPIHQNWDAFIY